MAIVIINEYLMTAAPFLNLKIKWATVKSKVKIVGKSAGYNWKLSTKFPLNNSIKDRCIPQPGQSIPDIALYGQVIKWSSSQWMIECIYKKIKKSPDCSGDFH